jgi:hypothetical protein
MGTRVEEGTGGLRGNWVVDRQHETGVDCGGKLAIAPQVRDCLITEFY